MPIQRLQAMTPTMAAEARVIIGISQLSQRLRSKSFDENHHE
jgi:hypothetical protein